jgi:hypothetical protein
MNEEELPATTPDRSVPRKQQFYKDIGQAVAGLTLPLGDDCPKLYPVQRWVEMAEIFARREKWEHAAACWKQACRLGGTPDEVAHYELELEYCQQQPAREAAKAALRAERKRKVLEQTTPGTLADYVARLPSEVRENFWAAMEQIGDRHEFCHDNKIADTDLGFPARGEGAQRVELAWFNMPVVWLVEAGVPPAVIEYHYDCIVDTPVDPRWIYERWIEFRCGPHCLWADTRGWFVDPYEPKTLYLYMD